MARANDQKRASDSSLDKVRLGGLVDIISNIGSNEPAAKSKDVLVRQDMPWKFGVQFSTT